MKRADLVAGISVAGLLLPEAVAYAGIAGLPPERAILAAIIGCLVYPLLGRSRFAIVSATSSSAAILAAALAAIPDDAGMRTALATLAVAMVGVLFMTAGMLRLGGLTGFIARPVLRGFAFGLAITIILRQLPILVGVPVAAPDVFSLAFGLVRALPHWHWVSVTAGICALVALLLLRRFPALPGALLVLGAGILATAVFDLPHYGVSTVGAIRFQLALPTLPSLSSAMLSHLARLVLPLSLILFAESWGTMRALALRHGDTVAPDRELRALGLANLVVALVQGMPVGAGFSAGSASESAGAQTRVTTLVAALGLAALIAVATPYIALLPQPVLAAVVIAALTHALDPAPLMRLWKLDRDQYVALGAALGVIVLGVLDGMIAAILLSLLAMVHRVASPQLLELGRLDTGHDFVDITRHPEAARVPGVVIWRAAQPLFFANAEDVLNEVEARSGATAPLHAIVFSLEESYDIDSTALDALLEFDRKIAAHGWALQLARVHDRVRDLLVSSEAAFAGRVSYSVEDAVVALAARPAPVIAAPAG